MGNKKNNSVAVGLLAIVVGMVCMVYASVPLYSLFCRVTGFAGTTRDSIAHPKSVVDREVTVNFDGNVMSGLSWKFYPEQKSVRLKVGEQRLALYKAVNTSSKYTIGTATYNVTPHKAGIYFNKTQCFCYTRQPLQPGQSADMPVSFFIDPDFAKDPDMADVDTITLSYSFYSVPDKVQKQ